MQEWVFGLFPCFSSLISDTQAAPVSKSILAKVEAKLTFAPVGKFPRLPDLQDPVLAQAGIKRNRIF